MATAGKVAPTWDSDGYNSEKTYEYYTMLMHNNKLWICKKDGTIGIEPSVENSTNWFLAMDSSFTDAATLDGHDSDYFATAESVENANESIQNIINGTTPAGDSNKLGNETAEAWQGKIDAIQTVSSSTLSTAGWYRIAKLRASNKTILGGGGNSCEILLRNITNATYTSVSRLYLDSRYQSQVFSVLSSTSANSRCFTKIRYTYDSENAYLEVYYSVDASNTMEAVIHYPMVFSVKWEAVDFEATEETVDGVTVTTTYDIPANAKPVNSTGETAIEAVGKDRYIAYPDGGYWRGGGTGRARITLPITSYNGAIFSFKVTISDFKSNEAICVYHIGGSPRSSGTWSAITAVSLGNPNSTKCNLAVRYGNDSNGNLVVTIGEDTTTWTSGQISISEVQTDFIGYAQMHTGWNVSITSDNSDLTITNTVENPFIGANYLPKNADGSVGTDVVALVLKGGADSTLVRFRDNTGGNLGALGIWGGADKLVFRTSTNDNREILHSGNVGSYALSVTGGTVSKSNGIPLTLEGSSNVSYIDYRNSSGEFLGLIGMSANGEPAYCPSYSIVRTLHHDGNSVKVLQAASAPSTTTAVWVDTANKKVKAYIDGAWTALA